MCAGWCAWLDQLQLECNSSAKCCGTEDHSDARGHDWQISVCPVRGQRRGKSGYTSHVSTSCTCQSLAGRLQLVISTHRMYRISRDKKWNENHTNGSCSKLWRSMLDQCKYHVQKNYSRLAFSVVRRDFVATLSPSEMKPQKGTQDGANMPELFCFFTKHFYLSTRCNVKIESIDLLQSDPLWRHFRWAVPSQMLKYWNPNIKRWTIGISLIVEANRPAEMSWNLCSGAISAASVHKF